MKNVIKLFVFVNSFYLFVGCNSDKWKTKTFKQKIESKEVIKKIENGRGNFLVLYLNQNIIDTIMINGYSNLFDKIDTVTLINKNRNSYMLILDNLKNSDGTRYTDSIQLIYW